MTKKIPLTKGKVALVDDDDFNCLNQWLWHYHGGYAARIELITHNTIYMHRVIANTPAGMDTDHINRDGLDNRRCNLRPCTRAQNKANVGIRAGNNSGIRGVSWNTERRKWVAQIMVNQKQVFIGRFDNLEDAAAAYQKKAEEVFGDFFPK